MSTKVKDEMLESPPVGISGELTEGTLAGKTVKLTATGKLPTLDASNLTNLDAGDLENALPAISGAALTNLPADPAAAIMGRVGQWANTAIGSVSASDVIAWATENVNEGSEFTTVDSDEHVQVATGGTYRLEFVGSITVTSTGSWEAQVQKDGGTGTWVDVGPISGAQGFAFFGSMTNSINFILDLLEDEKVRVIVDAINGGGSPTLPATGSLSLQQIL